MGVNGSLQSNSRSHEPPPLPPPFYTAGYFSNTSRTSSASEEPRHSVQQESRAPASLRNEEWWHHCRPSAPSQPHETLLTYAAQMSTGWQCECTPSAPSVHQEAMELTRIVSQLAAANQQLAGAHSVLLIQLEKLYVELSKEREARVTLERQIGIKDDGRGSLSSDRERYEDIQNYKSCSDDKEKISNGKEDVEAFKKEYQKAVERIQMLENELQVPNTEGSRAQCVDEIEHSPKKESTLLVNEDQVKSLLRELSRLQIDQVNAQEVNTRLVNEVDKQKKITDKQRREYENLKNHTEKVESRLNEEKNQLEAFMRAFDTAKLETSKLKKQLDAFHREKDTAATRILTLEKELQRVNQLRDETITHASEERWILRARLHEEITNKSKQTEALDESLREIQRLKDILDTVKKERVTDAETSTEDVAVEKTSLEEFKKDLSMKREARQRAIAAVSSEMDRLRRELDAEKEAHSETSRILDLLKTQAESVSRKSETFSVGTITTTLDDCRSKNEWFEPPALQHDAQRLNDVLKVSDELRACIRLQLEKIDDLRYHLECDAENNVHRINILKNIATTNREAYSTRETQINKLKNVLSQIVARLSDEKFRIDVTEDLRVEHDRQLEDIRRLKSLYDERMRVLVEIKESTSKELTSTKQALKIMTKEKELLDEDMKKADEKIDVQDTEISNLESQLGLTKADCRDLQNQMSVINSLFSQMLLSASSADMDLDRLTQLLQENHDLISEMARKEGTEAAALPKLLLDLVEQVEGREKSKSVDVDPEKKEEGPHEENIANNLPKVWAVLLELLSCHDVGSTLPPSALSTDPNSCYKSVDTPTGPRLVISVSKTYIRLKDLILEKKSLEKEMGRMKQLNSHLESKLGEQEKRLSTVADELSKTWNIVGRMQEQHQQLHTHEKILRYELQQKRKMLQELKQELEYCKEKWESARQKNTNTEIEWRNLRREFAARKALGVQDSFNNSAESGFSDERGDDSDDEDMPSEERLRTGPRRRTRKESPRAPTPDTESEQPTDTELSESKTGSTSTPERRTPTPETAEMNPEQSIEPSEKFETQSFNPVDQALANVIQNLIKIDSNDGEDFPDVTESSINEEPSACTGKIEEDTHMTDSMALEEPQTTGRIQQTHSELLTEDDSTDNIDTTQEENLVNSISVFSIGPFPVTCASSSKTVQFSDPLVMGPSTQVQPPILEAEVFLDTVPSSSDELIKESVSNDIAEEHLAINEPELPTESGPSSKEGRSSEELLAARAARLKRLEEQAEWLIKKMDATSRRGSALNTRLEELHEVYGEAPAPPPMPDVLPTVRLPTDANVCQEDESTPHSENQSDGT